MQVQWVGGFQYVSIHSFFLSCCNHLSPQVYLSNPFQHFLLKVFTNDKGNVVSAAVFISLWETLSLTPEACWSSGQVRTATLTDNVSPSNPDKVFVCVGGGDKALAKHTVQIKWLVVLLAHFLQLIQPL